MKKLIKKLIPAPHHQKVKRTLLKAFYWGTGYYCNMCESHVRKWLPLGYDLPVLKEKQIIGAGLRDVLCPVCGSSDRIRLLYHFLKTKTSLFRDDLKLLHIAPEPSLEYILKSHPKIDYLTADLNPDKVMMQMDITEIPFPEDIFDAIICNHVLEHIPNDRKAMSELFRVLKNTGWAILQVPISKTLENTFEDNTITEPEEREKMFGQTDHVRIYGQDYPKKLKNAGFKVEIYRWKDDPAINSKGNKLRLNPEEVVFFCIK